MFALALALALASCANNPPDASDAAASDAVTTRDVLQPDAGPDKTGGIADAAAGPADAPARQEVMGPDATDKVLQDAAVADSADRDVAVASDAEKDVAPSGEAGCSGWTTLKHLSPAEVADLIATSNPIVINVHTPYAGDIPGTDTSIPFDHVNDIDTYLHGDKCANVVLICWSGGMSQSAGNALINLGYLRVSDLDGGMNAWQKAGYPLLMDGGI
jgi:rhodanese-related sulfurtransferase